MADAKISNNRARVRCQQYIIHLDIAVHNAVVVHVRQTLEELTEH